MEGKETGSPASIAGAAEALLKGGFIVMHDSDGREDESDLVLLAEFATPGKVRAMRKDAGGLICVAVSQEPARRLKLPFATEIMAKCENPLLSDMCARRMAYGDMPAFSVSINHLSTFTGISDNDRSKTISEFASLVKRNGDCCEMKNEFRAVGHVFILVGRGIGNRRGHTELSLELSRIAHCGAENHAVVLCEMLSDSGDSAKKDEARRYAEKNSLPFIEGDDIVEYSKKQVDLDGNKC